MNKKEVARVRWLLRVVLFLVMALLTFSAVSQADLRMTIMKLEKEKQSQRREILAEVFYQYARLDISTDGRTEYLRAFRARFPSYRDDPKLLRLAMAAVAFRRDKASWEEVQRAYEACREK